ncbi:MULTISPECIES: hypothetical protein [Amycolatopsis]|uniref:Uncharacterized protein n=2 Tax=Amycolatopsis TaxID=1813 RepID=A0A1I6BCD9_9PSEU|nr:MULTISPECIES: hypothetical protein [Amycolatopsis]OAP22351.1 hypothetical protein A4R44_06801 [Amycolatopsis sp. M39]SFQ78610.1 hypothetical protein SAMN05421854_12558 [Amycolatopsis rubida]
MAKPSGLQIRNIIAAVLMAAAFVFNLVSGGPWWVTAIVGVAALLSSFSAYLNRPSARG